MWIDCYVMYVKVSFMHWHFLHGIYGVCPISYLDKMHLVELKGQNLGEDVCALTKSLDHCEMWNVLLLNVKKICSNFVRSDVHLYKGSW